MTLGDVIEIFVAIERLLTRLNRTLHGHILAIVYVSDDLGSRLTLIRTVGTLGQLLHWHLNISVLATIAHLAHLYGWRTFGATVELVTAQRLDWLIGDLIANETPVRVVVEEATIGLIAQPVEVCTIFEHLI